MSSKCVSLPDHVTVHPLLGLFLFIQLFSYKKVKHIHCETQALGQSALQPFGFHGAPFAKACDGLWDSMSSETAAQFVRVGILSWELNNTGLGLGLGVIHMRNPEAIQGVGMAVARNGCARVNSVLK